MPTCPDGHESAATDFCDVCGMRIGGQAAGTAAGGQAAGPASAQASSSGSASTSAAAPAGLGTTEGPSSAGETCPRCGTDRSGQFCEVCGFDFTSAAIA